MYESNNTVIIKTRFLLHKGQDVVKRNFEFKLFKLLFAILIKRYTRHY